MHGRAYIRQYADFLIDNGAEQIVIDPSVDNKPAVAAYHKAGFHLVADYKTEQGCFKLMAYLSLQK